MLEYKMQKKWISLFPHFRTIKNVKDRTNLKKIYSEGDMNYTK